MAAPPLHDDTESAQSIFLAFFALYIYKQFVFIFISVCLVVCGLFLALLFYFYLCILRAITDLSRQGNTLVEHTHYSHQ